MAKTSMPTSARRNCIACDMLSIPAQPGSPLCAECDSRGIKYATDRINNHRTFSDELVAKMYQHLSNALNALSDDDRARWRAFDRARRQVADGEADEATKKRVEAMVKALKEKSTKVASLVDVYVSEEAWWWAAKNQELRYKRANELLGILQDWQEKQKQQEVVA